MTWAAGKGVVGAEPNIIVEIDFDKCVNTYGTAPCTATGATGDECYNGRKHCQDTANYDQTAGTLTVRLSMADRGVLPGLNAFPCIQSINVAPTKLRPGKGLSSRGKVDIVFSDFTDNDSLTDPYFSTRNYIATDQGTFWGKLLSRFPFHVGRTVRIKMGYAPLDGTAPSLSDYDKTLTYIIDRIDGPDASGRVKLVGKDVLDLANTLKNQIPTASEGTLSAAINSTTGSIPLQTGEGADYASTSGTASIVRISDELIYCTGRSGDTLTGGTRGYAGSTAASHDDDDGVQLCYEVGFLGTDRVDAVVEDILTNYAGIDASYINTTGWSDHTTDWMNTYNLKNIISEPMAVSEALDQICTETGVDLWWSDDDAQINFLANVPQITTIPTLDDSKINDKGSDVKREAKERLSQVWFFHDIRDYAGERDKIGNFSGVQVRTDTDSEGANEYNQKGIKKVYCNWVQTSAIAGQQATRLLNRYIDPPLRVKARLPNDCDDVYTGQQVYFDSDLNQSPDGTNQNITMQVVSHDFNMTSGVIDVEMLTFLSSVGRAAFICPTGTADYTTTGADANPTYSWICSTSTALMPNGDEPYLII